MILTAFPILSPTSGIAFAQTAQDENWKNYYSLVHDTKENNVRYAKQMGYDYINVYSWYSSYYKSTPTTAGMKFYMLGPHLYYQVFETLENYKNLNGAFMIDKSRIYTSTQAAWYSAYMVNISANKFPDNLATGWWNGSNKFEVLWDFQQQAVIDYVVEKIIKTAGTFAGNNFNFAGYQFDVPDLAGCFYKWDSTKGGQTKTTLKAMTGSDSGIDHIGLNGTKTKDFAAYPDGLAAFFKQLMRETKKIYPNAKWIIDPARIYSTTGYDEWVNGISQRQDKADLIPDLVMEEGASTNFVDEPKNFDYYDSSGVKIGPTGITKNMVGSNQRSKIDENINRLIAAKAGVNGAWYNWFLNLALGNMSSTFTDSVANVYPRLKLIKCIPNWDNLNAIAVDSSHRAWNKSTTDPVYDSYDANGYQQSHIDKDVMYSRHWKTGKLFAVFTSTSGVIQLKPGEALASIRSANEYFEENLIDASGDVSTAAAGDHLEIKLKSTFDIAIDTANSQIKGVGYILTISKTGNLAPVITSALSSTGTAATALSYQITAANSPTSFSAAGLPAGLSVSTTTGLISGTPTAAATSNVALSASNTSGTGVSTLTLSVYSACDLNRDASTNVVDVQLQVNAALGAAACASDLNRDGLCNVIDVQRDVNASLGGQCLLGP
ncbi:MAG: hypothetical protein A2X37_12020 [Elusimicrobia bacterium GWA2_66_18]|nr:MAG: hypothetical protein A2X37_12020 [Elusimicrobia bacterium GWA2_66_18]